MTKQTGRDGPTKSRAAGKKAPGRPRGPSFAITPELREAVARLAAVGTKHDVIARIVKISVDTLTRHFATELAWGLTEANAVIAATLYDKAKAGDATSIIWWEKTRGGHREISRHELTGQDGGPIEYRKLTDEEVDARIAALIGSGGASEPAD